MKVLANGNWTVSILPLSKARRWDGTAALTGSGDDVVIVSAKDGFGATKISARGSGNFIIWAYDEDGSSDLLVNEIDTYKGEVLLPATPVAMLEISAAGVKWSLGALSW
jgi:hypothetical protein